MIALVISLTLWPNHARGSLRQSLAAAIEKLGALYRELMAHRAALADPLDKLKTQVSDVFRRNTALLENALQEAFGPMRERESLALLAAQVDRIRQALETIEFALRDGAADTYFRTFDAELEQVHAANAAAFIWLANSIRSGQAESPWQELMPVIAALEAKATLARKSGATASYPLDEILRFYALLLSSRNLAHELELARALELPLNEGRRM